MFHPRHFVKRPRAAFAAALAFTFLLLAPAAGAQAGGEPQSQAPPFWTFEFSAPEYVIREIDRHVDITVLRRGDLTAQDSVDYATVDEALPGRASQKGDYEIALGRLTFAPGESSKTFRVLLNSDGFTEGDEEIGLALTYPFAGGVGGLGAQNTAKVRLNDSAAQTPDDDFDFVRQHYADFLNREADTDGALFWLNEIQQCGSDAQCREVKRINVSAAFFLSVEFQRTGMIAYLTHKAAFGTRPPYERFERETQALQRNYVFGQPGADAVLEANKQLYFYDFIGGIDFANRYPTTMSPAQFVDALYANTGITPTTQERNAAIAEFTNSTTDTTDSNARARALRRVAETPSFSRAEFNAAFVLMEYFGYLRRDPDDAGYNFWLNKLNQFNGDFIRAEMVKAFISSTEYRQRFGP